MAGTFVVVAAGNEGPACSSLEVPPAIYAEAFSVGAVDESGAVTSFSSRGPVTVDGSGRAKPDIVAPGQEILSAVPGSSYGFQDGTSMAGPHVAGVVALIWSANPSLIGDVSGTEQILSETARAVVDAPVDCSPSGTLPSNVSGYGVVDAFAAVQRALELPGP